LPPLLSRLPDARGLLNQLALSGESYA